MEKINRRTTVQQTKTELTTINEDGTKKVESYLNLKEYINNEEDYAKIYGNGWKKLIKHGITAVEKATFVSIANHMDYCNTSALRNSQIVKLEPCTRAAIMEECGITNEKVFYRHLKSLTDAGVLRCAFDEHGKKRRGVYQINPKYASKGKWYVNSNYAVFGANELLMYWDSPDMYTMTKSFKCND